MPFTLEKILISKAHIAAAQARGADARHGVACAIQSIIDARHALSGVRDTMPEHDANRKTIEQAIAALA
jgi:hypothetical protein